MTEGYITQSPCAVTFPWWGRLRTSMTRIAMLAGVFILFVGPPRQVEG